MLYHSWIYHSLLVLDSVDFYDLDLEDVGLGNGNGNDNGNVNELFYLL